MIFSKLFTDYRPAVYVAGLAAAAVTSGVFLYRWQQGRKKQQQTQTVQTEDLNELSDQAPAQAPAPTQASVPVPEPIPEPSSTINPSGALVPFWNSRSQGITRNHSWFETSFLDWFTDGKKIEMVTYHHRAKRRGLSFGKAWSLKRNFYKPCTGLSTRNIGRIKTRVSTKGVGRQIIYLKNKTQIKKVNTTLIPGKSILKRMATTSLKRVFVENNDLCWSAESDSIEIIEMPVFSPPTNGTYEDVFPQYAY